MIKITVDSAGEILKAEPAATKEIYLDWNMEEGVYFKDGKYVKMADVILPETEITKTIQRANALQHEYLVNITTSNKKKKATVITKKDAVGFDPERGDAIFATLEEAEAYAKEFNSK